MDVREIKAHIFVYHIEPDQAPTRKKVRSGWRAEVVSELPKHEELITRVYSTRERAINALMEMIKQRGYIGTSDIWTMSNTRGDKNGEKFGQKT